VSTKIELSCVSILTLFGKVITCKWIWNVATFQQLIMALMCNLILFNINDIKNT
jgi:hypothetical protein